MTSVEILVLAAYFLVLSVLAVYGWHRSYLVYLYMKNRVRPTAAPGPPAVLPLVTVQLPVFNELYVVDRLIDAVCRLDYPKDRLEIQVLDDSTDETRSIVELAVRRHAARGFAIVQLHREDRRGFKAGALAEGLRQARGDVIAIFDADFVPPPDFLRRAIPHLADPGVGMVQARWGHLNEGYSLLTRVQAILLDGHFVLEHGARHLSGCFFNFNGTAGLWRRAAIEDAGGWQHDTLTEDLDLSYRAQLAGWRFVFLPDLVAPAEVPVEMNAFKSQQHRWARGSIQTCMKLLPRLLASDLPPAIKREAFFHLTANFNYVLMLLLSLLMFPAMYVRYSTGWTEMLLIDLPLFCAATLSVTNFYAICQREIHADWLTRLRNLPLVLAVGIGLSVNNSRAVFEAFFASPGEFQRTAKYGIERTDDDWFGKRYHQSTFLQPIVEVMFGAYFTAAVAYALASEIYGTLPFLVLFQVGFLYTGLLSLVQQTGGGGVALTAQAVRTD